MLIDHNIFKTTLIDFSIQKKFNSVKKRNFPFIRQNAVFKDSGNKKEYFGFRLDFEPKFRPKPKDRSKPKPKPKCLPKPKFRPKPIPKQKISDHYFLPNSLLQLEIEGSVI